MHSCNYNYQYGALMSYRICRTNKKSGVSYIYEVESYWDKIRKQPRNKQVCVGKLDPTSGKFIPSKRLSPAQAAIRDPQVTATAEIVGPCIVLDFISKYLGIPNLLKACFSTKHKQILTMAYYLTSCGGALSHCESWCKNHAHPFLKPLTSQRISEILASITINEKQTFLHKWMKKALENDYLCYDITSVSSYAKCNEYLKYGYNRDGEKLPQINLAMLFGQISCLPLYYHQMPGNIADVSTLHNLLKTFKALDIKSLNCVMDKGFYSKKNINTLLASRNKFTLPVPINNKWIQRVIDEVYDVVDSPQGYRKLDNEILYIHSKLYPWGKNRRRCYLHLYYNAHMRAIEVDKFNEKLIKCKKELESGKLVNENQKAYEMFFLVKTTPKKGTKVSYNNDAVRKYIKRYAGFQAILSNSIKDPVKALQIYRDKDVVEKSFNDLKNQLDMKRLRMHSSAVVEGRLFIQFISLILISAIRKEMRNTGLIERYTPRELLQEMESLTKVKYTGRYGHILTEVSKSQREILELLGIHRSNWT